MINSETQITLDIAAAAHVDPRTVAAYMAGKKVRPTNRDRIAEAILKMDKQANRGVTR